MELDNYHARNTAGCSKALKGCAILTLVACIGVAALLIWLVRMPTLQKVTGCAQNVEAIGGALQRYYDLNGSYPESLDDLKKEYLKDPSVLRCPSSRSQADSGSYIYNRPSENSPGSFVMLECNRHVIGRTKAPIKVTLRKDGNVKIEAPKAQDSGKHGAKK